MPRLDIRCSDLELDAWRAAAGREPLSSWVRRALNAAEAIGAAGDPELPPALPESPNPGTPESRTVARPHMKRHRPAVQCSSRVFVDGVCPDCGALELEPAIAG